MKAGKIYLITVSLILFILIMYVTDNKNSKYKKEFFKMHKNALSVVVLNDDGNHKHYFVAEPSIINGCMSGKFYSQNKSEGSIFKRMRICSNFRYSE